MLNCAIVYVKQKSIVLFFRSRGNCHPQILAEMRKYYPKPHFLPESCEIPSKEYIFMGYDDGATMHVCNYLFIYFCYLRLVACVVWLFYKAIIFF